jgi:putative hydrolase of the HAD superfamily
MSEAAPVRAVLLDAFGTLLHLDSPAPLLRLLLKERLELAVTEAQASAALAAEIAYYRAHMAQGSDARTLADLHLRCAEVLRAALPVSPALQSAGAQTIVSLLLRGAGLRLVVVSNWDATLESVLERVGLLDAVDGVVSSAVAGAAKPDPHPLRLGLEIAGVGAAEAIHVGDDVDEDVRGAIAAGIRPVLLDRGRHGQGERPGREPQLEVPRIATLDQLVTLVGL